jgi:hypothetical protein
MPRANVCLVAERVELYIQNTLITLVKTFVDALLIGILTITIGVVLLFVMFDFETAGFGELCLRPR